MLPQSLTDTNLSQGVAILCAVLVVVSVSAVNDYQKEQQFRALNAVKDDVQVCLSACLLACLFLVLVPVPVPFCASAEFLWSVSVRSFSLLFVCAAFLSSTQASCWFTSPCTSCRFTSIRASVGSLRYSWS